MTDSSPSARKPRPPRVFDAGDRRVVLPPEPTLSEATGAVMPDAADRGAPVPPLREQVGRGVRWGGILLASMAGLAGLAASVAFAGFVSRALDRQDWIGWLAFGLLSLGALAALILIGREVIGFVRLVRLQKLKTSIDEALRDADAKKERAAVSALQNLYAGRPECRWRLKRLAEHAGDVSDAGDLLRLADREVMAPLDLTARRLIVGSAKRVATVTALSPMVWIAMLFVLVENLRLMRGLASLYGGRPGLGGTLKLARMVIGHIIATGGVAMTDDLLGQFLGQDMVRRLSRRLGEGVFNGALTARLGVAAVGVVRPVPFLDAEPLRVRDLVREVFRRGEVAAGNEGRQG